MRKLIDKVVVLVSVMFMLVVSIVGNSYAAYDNKYPDGMIPIDQVNETFLKEYALKHIPKGAKLISVKATFVYFNNDKDVVKPVPAKPIPGYPSLEPQWGWPYYYITNVSGPYEAWGIQYVAKVAGGPGPTTIHMSQSASISNSFSANVNVSADVVSAGVGFNVTGTYTTTFECDLSIPAGCYGAIEAHPIYDVYSYDVMYNPASGNPYKVGNGSASKAVGVFYYKYTWR